jgi:hypothetical protein
MVQDDLFERPSFLRESVTPSGYAKRIDVSPTTVHKYLDDEHDPLPSGYIGNKRLIHIPTADAWLKRRLGIVNSPSDAPGHYHVLPPGVIGSPPKIDRAAGCRSVERGNEA